MIFFAIFILCYTKNKITCYMDYARVASFSASEFFNSDLA